MAKGIIDVIEIQVTEKIPRGHDWSKNLPSGTSINTVAATAVDLDDQSDATANVIDSSATSGSVTTFVVKAPAASNRKNYKVTLKMTRNPDSAVYEDDYLLRVRDV